MSQDTKVASHYASEGIAERLLQALRDVGANMEALTPLELAPLDQFHFRGLDATNELAEFLDPKAEERILDIGCGLGGPARYLAFTHGVTVDGVDLTPEFCEAARQLNITTALDDHVSIECASALDLPFADDTFDGAYSQNVVMNIADKPAFYREAWRVLKPGGRLALSNLALGAAGELVYPVPWATTAETSFLATPAETRKEIEAAGFKIMVFRNTAQKYKEFMQTQRERIRRDGPPKLGLHFLMGERFKDMQRNGAQNVEEGRVLPLEILCHKP